MKFLKMKKGIAALAAVAIVAIAAIGAYAYFTSAGSGSGDVAVGSNTTDIHLSATISPGIVPGDYVPVSFKAWNLSTTTGYVADVSLGTVTDTSGIPNANCVAYLAAHQNHFSLTDSTGAVPAPVVEGNAIAANTTSGTAVSLSNAGRLYWANSSTVDQTPCVGETFTVGVTSS